MNSLKLLIGCIFGPRLDAFYKLSGHTLTSTTPEVLNRSHRYRQSSLESISDYVIRFSKTLTNIGTYCSPIMLTYLLYKRIVPPSTSTTNTSAIVSSPDQSLLLKLFMSTIIALFSSFCIRGFARYSNQEYLTFLRVLQDTRTNPNASNKRILNHIDADFSAYPVDFRWSESRNKGAPAPYKDTFPIDNDDTSQRFILEKIPLRLPLDIVISIIMRCIGRRIIYPGTLSFLQAIMKPAISSGRSKLIEDFGGVRNKLESYDGNHIDTMFIDRRGNSPNGDYLVIGCEGNGGFYEVGTILTPLEAGYSVLGWNHPGFGGSTGAPYPDQEVAAVDTAVNFALDKLNFGPSQIVLYGWSIGGFTATWAGMRHPNVHGLVIDASFDHIIPLARKLFPNFLYPIIEMAIKQHFDLNNSRHLKHYKGPVLLIRRSQDEVISLDPYNSPPTNRANYLLIDLLKQRFPKLMNDRSEALVHEYLAGNARYQAAYLKRYSISDNACLRQLLEYFHTQPTSYPVNIGPDLDNVSREQLVLYLANKHLIDYDAVHCAPLPPTYFQRPWNLIGIAMSSSNL